VAERLDVHVGEVRNVIIWGNHSSTQFPDVSHGTVGGRPIAEAVADDAWLHGEFIATVQQRGAAIIKARARPACACRCMHGRQPGLPFVHVHKVAVRPLRPEPMWERRGPAHSSASAALS
jgi:hypothetical protein